MILYPLPEPHLTSGLISSTEVAYTTKAGNSENLPNRQDVHSFKTLSEKESIYRMAPVEAAVYLSSSGVMILFCASFPIKASLTQVRSRALCWLGAAMLEELKSISGRATALAATVERIFIV